MSEVVQKMGPRPAVRCQCGHTLFDGVVVKSRVVRLFPLGGAEALCRCKRWITVPLTYQPIPVPQAHGQSMRAGLL